MKCPSINLLALPNSIILMMSTVFHDASGPFPWKTKAFIPVSIFHTFQTIRGNWVIIVPLLFQPMRIVFPDQKCSIKGKGDSYKNDDPKLTNFVGIVTVCRLLTGWFLRNYRGSTLQSLYKKYQNEDAGSEPIWMAMSSMETVEK